MSINNPFKWRHIESLILFFFCSPSPFTKGEELNPLLASPFTRGRDWSSSSLYLVKERDCRAMELDSIFQTYPESLFLKRNDCQFFSRNDFSCLDTSGKASVTVVQRISRSTSKYACINRLRIPTMALQGISGSIMRVCADTLSGSFANDLNRANQSEQQHLIGIEIITCTAAGKALRRSKCINHVL